MATPKTDNRWPAQRDECHRAMNFFFARRSFISVVLQLLLAPDEPRQ